MESLLPWLLATFARAVVESMATPVPTETVAETKDGEALHEPADIALDSEAGTTLLAGVRTVLDEKLSGADRRRLGRKVLSPARVRMAAGAFPAGGTAVVTINVPLRMKDPLAEPRFISGVITLDAAGTLASIVVPPKMQADRFELTGIGDTDGDGHDDLALAVVGPTDRTQRVVRWTDGAPTGL